MHLGLGIDAGGTYTDSVLFDFTANAVLSKGKSLTTKDDYTKGIANSLNQVVIEEPHLVDLVGLSTTLATNALVEGKGARAGLLLIGYDEVLVKRLLRVGPYWLVDGGHDMRGQEKAGLDLGQVRQTVKLMSQECEVIAISQMGGAVNPSHERQVQELIQREFSIPAISGHEISQDMDSMKRATTVFWNARLIPVILELIGAVKTVLSNRGINAPIMLVRSDGTMMGVELAGQRPIETLMSGPVASVYGALHLTETKDALVIDMGGTTTDVGLIKGGLPRLSPGGARIGDYAMTVKTLDLHTTGLGGDSEIRITGQGQLAVGPRRVMPIGLAARQNPNIHREIDEWESNEVEHVDSNLLSPVEFYLPMPENGSKMHFQLSGREGAVLKALNELGGASRYGLARAIGYDYPSLLPMEHLEELGLVQKVGLTPTDVLEALGRLDNGKTGAARGALAIFSRRFQLDSKTMAYKILEAIEGQLAREMLGVLLEESIQGANGLNGKGRPNGVVGGRGVRGVSLNGSPVCEHLVRLALDKDNGKPLSCTMRIGLPLVAVGAPVAAYFPPLAEEFGTELHIPPHADVANAVGAITGSIRLTAEVVVAATGDEQYIVHGMPENNTFEELEDALAQATEYVEKVARSRAETAGAESINVEISKEEVWSEIGHQTLESIFLEMRIIAHASGRPKTRV